MKVMIFLSFLALSSIVSAKTFYVATPAAGGSDSNPGTLASPWSSWAKAFTSTSVQPGDTVYFRGGVYYTTVTNGSGIVMSREGTAAKWIYYWAYPDDYEAGNFPILDCSNSFNDGTKSRNIGLTTKWLDYLHFKGLTIRSVFQRNNDATGGPYDLPTYGWSIQDGNIIIENCTMHDIHGTAFIPYHNGIYGEVYGKPANGRIYLLNCDAYNCNDIYTDPAPAAGRGGHGTGFSGFSQWGTDGYTYLTNCRAWNCSDQGFAVGGDAYIIIDGCWSFNNKSYLNGEGNGFKMGWATQSVNDVRLKVRNCISAFNDGWGFHTNDYNHSSIRQMNIFNNTSYQNRYWGFGIFNTSASDGEELKRVFKNNLAYDNKIAEVQVQTNALYAHANNSWDNPPGITISEADFISINPARLPVARQADGSLPDLNGFLKLKETSKAIDAGVNVGLPFINTAPDLGAFEFDPQPNSNMYPTVVIISPSPGSTFSAPASISINANAFDSDGLISKVEFFNGAVKLGEKTSSPWSFTWNNVPEGTYSITAVATDDDNAKTTSSVVSITVNNPPPVINQPPVVSVSSPVAGSLFTSPANITITANASDSDGLITKVEFFNGATKLGEKTSSPWSFAWNNVSAGIYSLLAVATDNLNAKTTSSAVSITVNSPPQPPAITITNPVAGSTFTAPANITITANATDADGTVSKVEFFNGANKLGEKTSSPWSFTWSNVSTGTYSLTALATDNSNSKTTSPVVSVTVNDLPPVANKAPVISISNPVNFSTFTVPVNITITANASDADGTVSKVEFFNGSSKIGEKASVPWSFTWNSLPVGTHSLTAVATDNLNARTTSSAVSITVNDLPPVLNQPPVVSILNPAKGQQFMKYQDIVLEAVASDPDGTISKVEFYNGSTKLVEITSPPYAYVWKYMDEGNYSISALAVDNLNSATVSTSVWIEVRANTFYDGNSSILNIFPNPNDGHFSVTLINPGKDETYAVHVISSDGKYIYQGFMSQEEIIKHFDLSNIKPGTYILILLNSFEIIATKKFIKN